MIAALFVRFSAVPAAMERPLTMLVPSALLGLVLLLIATLPAVMISEDARMFSNCAVPAPVLVIIRPVAVSAPVIASVLVAGVTVMIVSLASVSGAAIVWLPAMTLIAGVAPLACIVMP